MENRKKVFLLVLVGFLVFAILAGGYFYIQLVGLRGEESIALWVADDKQEFKHSIENATDPELYMHSDGKVEYVGRGGGHQPSNMGPVSVVKAENDIVSVGEQEFPVQYVTVSMSYDGVNRIHILMLKERLREVLHGRLRFKSDGSERERKICIGVMDLMSAS